MDPRAPSQISALLSMQPELTESEAARALHAEGGMAAFYSGLGLKLLRAVPMSAVGFFAYEHAMALLARRHQKAL